MSSFMRRLIILSIYSMLTAVTVMAASAYIFMFRLIVPINTTDVSSMESHLIFQRQTAISIENDTMQISNLNHTSSSNTHKTSNTSLSFVDEIHEEISSTTMATYNEPLDWSTVNQTSDFDIGGNNTNATVDKRPQKNPIDIAAIEICWKRFRQTWGNSKAYVLSSSAIAFIASFFQFFSAAVIVYYGRSKTYDKILRQIAFRWVAINCITALILVTVVVSNSAMDSDPEKASGNPNYLSELEYNRDTDVIYTLTPLVETTTEASNSTSAGNGSTGGVQTNNYEETWNTINAIVTKYIVANFYNTIIALDIFTLFVVILSSACILRLYESPSYGNVLLVK